MMSATSFRGRVGHGWPTGGSMKRISHRIIRIRVKNSYFLFYCTALHRSRFVEE